MNEMFNFYKGKRVLVTGHTGFKGSWLTLILTEMGATVKGVSLNPLAEPNHFDLLELESKISHSVVDIRDAEKLEKEFREFEPEIVFHLAAQALVRRSYQDPSETYSTNVIGSLNLLEAVNRTKSVRSLVYVTSDKCYENLEWDWGYRENDILGGADPYSSSKACAEILFSSYSRSFFKDRSNFSAASVRAGNVIGGGDWSADRIIPDCVRAAENNSSILIRNPSATRPWQHVLEPLSGYLKLAMNMFLDPVSFRGAWNFGPSGHESKTVFEVTGRVLELLGAGKIEIEKQVGAVHEATLLQLNCDRANQILGWYPKWTSEVTILRTAQWFKEFRDGTDAQEITLNQIREYFEVAI